jgi:hypothetical protein
MVGYITSYIKKNKIIYAMVFGPVSLTLLSSMIYTLPVEAAVKAPVQNQALDVHAKDTSHPVKLELRLLQHKTKLIGTSVIGESDQDKMSIVETVYTVRARAFGGDVYLPAYQEQIIFEPVFTYPEEGTNAVVLGTPTITLSKSLAKSGDRYILKEYEEVDMYVSISLKVLHAYAPDRLVMKTKLSTISWFPTVYQNGSFDAGVDGDTGERLLNIPLVKASYIGEQITRVDWLSEPVVIIKAGAYLQAVKKQLNQSGQASVIGVFSRWLRLGK